jgi:hypothetical protein
MGDRLIDLDNAIGLDVDFSRIRCQSPQDIEFRCSAEKDARQHPSAGFIIGFEGPNAER